MRRIRTPAVLTALLLVLPVLAPARADAQGSRFDNFPEAEPKPGQQAPDFTLKTLDGETFTLSEAVARQPVVIEFGSYT